MSVSGDHSKCAGCGAWRCDGQDHGLCKHCGDYLCKNGHTTISYEWAEDNASCTAKRICSQTQETVETELINADKTATQQLSCTDDEISNITADFTHRTFAKQEKNGIKTAGATGHSYDDDNDNTCNTCGAERTAAHTCNSESLTAITQIDATHFAEGKKAHYKCSCGKYFEDNTGLAEITNFETWGVIPKTDHQLSGWKTDASNTKHWKECTIEGCTHKEQEANHSGGTATCQAKKACEVCGTAYGDLGAHDYDDSQWGYKGSDGHAHCCKTDGCTAYDTPVAHIPGPEATETTPQTCTACGYVIKEALGHLCANHLIFVPAKAATCTEEGNIEYYRCPDDGKLYTDTARLLILGRQIIQLAQQNEFAHVTTATLKKKSQTAWPRSHSKSPALPTS